jgi:hypothetical protein
VWQQLWFLCAGIEANDCGIQGGAGHYSRSVGKTGGSMKALFVMMVSVCLLYAFK